MQETLYLMLLRYCHQGDKEGAKKILEHMQNAGVPVTEKIYHALIHCHGRAKYVLPTVNVSNGSMSHACHPLNSQVFLNNILLDVG